MRKGEMSAAKEAERVPGKGWFGRRLSLEDWREIESFTSKLHRLLSSKALSPGPSSLQATLKDPGMVGPRTF
jgi:hypothetical protein